MHPSLRGLLASLGVFRVWSSRRRRFPPPGVERRRPEIAAESYAARHLLEHTLDCKANLRRLAPTSPRAARRYRELLGYELEGLQEMARVLHATAGGPDLPELLVETSDEIERLRVEVAWCDTLLRRPGQRPPPMA